MSYIKLPLKGTENPLQDYCVVSVDGVYELDTDVVNNKSVIHLYYPAAASTSGDYLRVSITYDGNGVVTADDIDALRLLILKVNGQPGNVPMFKLIDDDGSDDYKVQLGVGQGTVAKGTDPK